MTAPHLENNTANAPYIDLRCVSLLSSFDNLRRHPEDGALHCCERSSLCIVGALGNPEVRDFADPSVLNKDVVSFEVLWAININSETFFVYRTR